MKKIVWTIVLFIYPFTESKSQNILLPKSQYSWTAAQAPKEFNGKLQFSFVNANIGFPNYGTVLSGGGYMESQDGGVFQLYFPYSSNLGGKVPLIRLGVYNNQGWSEWQTFFTSANSNNSTSDWKAKNLIIYDKVGIGVENPLEQLSVKGNIRAKEIKVEATNWPDYVFQKDYDLKSLGYIKEYILSNGHLPNIPKGETIEAEGLSVGNMNRLLLEKIEELTLHLIEKEEQLEKLELKFISVENRLNELIRR